MYEKSAKRMSVAAKRLALLLSLVVIVISVVGIPEFAYGKEKPDLEIKKINNRGTGVIKIPIPGLSNTVYVIGSSVEKVFTVKVKNNTKKEKRDVKVKLFAYDKKGELIGEKSPYIARALYAQKGYSSDEGVLQRRKSVKFYFEVSKKTKYVKAELFCGDEVVDVDTYPSSFPERLK